MGRTDAVAFTLEWAAEARRLGATVEFEPGWETRGNGTMANYEGGLLHHTAFLSSQTNPLPAKSTLKAGRTDLPGPLCNVAGPWCQDGSPLLVVIAAHPANHAGASGGKSMGPLPVTSLFNPRVYGLEIDYGGVAPMAKGQRKAGVIFSRALTNVLGRSAEYVRAHAETSVTGKWDPGYAKDKTIDMAAFRRDVTAFAGGGALPEPSEEDDMTAVKIIGIKDTDPAWSGYWAVNMATFQAKHLNGPQFVLYGGASAVDHKDQGRDMLAGFMLVE